MEHKRWEGFFFLGGLSHAVTNARWLKYLGHDFGVGVLDGVGPLHGDHVSPDLHLAAHQAASGLSCRFVVFVLQEAKATVLFLVVRLVVQYDIIQTLCGGGGGQAGGEERRGEGGKKGSGLSDCLLITSRRGARLRLNCGERNWFFFSQRSRGFFPVPGQILAVNCHCNESHSSISKRSSCGHRKVPFDCHLTASFQNKCNRKSSQRPTKPGADSPVTLANSSTICSFVLLLGMEPTNSLLLATEMHTPMGLPGRISLLLHCRGGERHK